MKLLFSHIGNDVSDSVSNKSPCALHVLHIAGSFDHLRKGEKKPVQMLTDGRIKIVRWYVPKKALKEERGEKKTLDEPRIDVESTSIAVEHNLLKE